MMDQVMTRDVVEHQRPRVLTGVREPVLEIGFGTGLNLPHYPESVTRLLALDPNPGMERWARPRVEASRIQVEPVPFREGGRLPLDDASLESVVSTWTLCSVRQVETALAEIARVLRPGGRFFFIEHGLSPDPDVAGWQHRLNRLHAFVLDGCCLNRDIPGLINEQHLNIEHCRRFYMPDSWKVSGYTYRGVARKP
jgi:ubiquinone/menaquinone biosynthesis C-methylase UbiE